jgi:hypothetical protein
VSATRLAVYKRALNHGAFGIVPLIFTAFFMYVALRTHAFAVDFHNGEWPAGQRILHGLSPYFGPHSAAVLGAGSARPKITPMVYPAPGALLFALFALIPHALADAVFTALEIAAVLVGLRVAGVRDWRLYGVAFLWPPVISGWQTANVTLLLVLGLAAIWRYRDSPVAAGLILASVVSVKLILWPLGLWLLVTRRFVALGYALAAGLALNAAAWAVLGLNELHRYTQVLSAFNAAGERRAYSTWNFAVHLGAGHAAASAIAAALAVLAALACVVLGWRGRDRGAFALCVAVALLATPIVWLHYFALLLVPLVLLRPRLSVVWLVPLALIVCPPTEPATWQIALALGVTAIVMSAGLSSTGVPIGSIARGLIPPRVRADTATIT